MKVWLIKDHQGKFHPLDSKDKEICDKIQPMDEHCFELKKVRNPKFHRKYFALIRIAFDNQDEYKDEEKFRKVMQMKAGYHEFVQTDKGEMWWPKSIAFGELDELEFEELYNKVWHVLQERYGFDNELFEAELASFL